MSTKAALKAAKSALDNKQYDQAIEHANSVLSSDPQNHFAKLFLGRALEKLGKYDEAASTYQAAAKAKPDDPQAWQGLLSLYKAQGSKQVDGYREAAVKVAEHFANAEDLHRAQSTVDELTAFTKQYGTSSQRRKVLEVMLPGSPIYDSLEGRIPRASHTLTRLVELTEAEEADRVKKEINERRTRIGAKIGQVTLEVKREVFASSNLEDLYQQLINWSTDDDIRREYEEKLLQRAYDTLIVLPLEQKAAKLDQVLTLAEGMVIIHHPHRLAWDLVLESRDVDDLKELDAGILREYVTVFENSGLARILQGWLTSELSPFPAPPKTQDEEPVKEIRPEDRLLLLSEGLADAEASPFAHRLVSDYYLYLEEHGSAAETARNGLKVAQVEGSKLGLGFQNTRDALNAVLGTSLVHHQAPRNHPEARRLFEDILQRKPKFTPALIGLGLILEETEDYDDAINFFMRALEEDKGNVRVGTELAWCRALSGDYPQALKELEDSLELIKADDPRTRDLRALTIYRIGVCVWESDTSKTARRDRNGAYRHFLAAIKTNVNFAPAYTKLGIYYGDYAKDKKRARQCFQKAFELSPTEIEAAERLAKSFADQGDWDIVEVVAQRVVDSGKARPPPGSKKKGISWPYSALGVVQMNKQEYQQAIVSFLSALRISPDDYQSYVGLGESYHNSGRYNSALRTFTFALQPHDDAKLKVTGETWFAQYMLANVHRELGDYDEAAAGLKSVLEDRPSEFGVLMSLLQCYTEHASRCIEKGLFGQAVQNALDALTTAVKVAKDMPRAFNLWKAVGDACSIFSWAQSSIKDFPSDAVQELLNVSAEQSMYELLADVDQISLGSLDTDGADQRDALPEPLVAAMLAYKRAVHAAAHDVHAQAVAWYNLGWAEQRAHASSTAKAGRRYLTTAVRCFKRAIELEAGNPELWNALGVVTTTLKPKVAQHAFVRSLHLNELNAKVWANLGVLYLLQNDMELAHQSFGRAQSTDPEYAHAWVGEGIIALLTGDTKEALNHFTHAFEISDSASLISKRQYTTSSFDFLLDAGDATTTTTTATTSNDLTTLIQPLFALEQLRTQVPHDLPYRHLSALFLERVGNHADAIAILADLSATAESDYEATESLASLARYALAKADLARNQLATSAFAAAAENAALALDLSSDADASGLAPPARRKLRLSAHLTSGLAAFYLRDSASSIAMFRAALVESSRPSDPDIVCSLAQVLWTQGGAEERAVAREQLMDAAGLYPEHVGVLMLLGVVAGLEGDGEVVEGVKGDLDVLRTSSPSSADGKKPGGREEEKISLLLSTLSSLLSPHGPSTKEISSDPDSNTTNSLLTQAQTSILLSPTSSHAWTSLASLSGSTSAAQMALRTAQHHVPPHGTLDAAGLAGVVAGQQTLGDGQRAVVLAPWEGTGWEAMRETLLEEER